MKESKAQEIINRHFNKPEPERKTEDKEITESLRAMWIERADGAESFMGIDRE